MTTPDVTEIRSQFDIKGLETFLSNWGNNKNVIRGPSVPKFSAPLTVKQFKFGQSNPSYYIADKTGREFVLRRKPVTNAKLVSRSAHAIEREFFILRGIGIVNQKSEKKVPVPDVYMLCEDESVIGYVFYLMEYINGRQIKNPSMPGFDKELSDKHWDAIMETISAIHSLDVLELIKELPASHFPQFQPENLQKLANTSYFERQIKSLGKVEKLQSKTVPPIPNFDNICKWLLENAPNDPSKLTLVHGDFKIDNILFHPTEPKTSAVLDWELCTFGHPLFDLSNFLQPFQLPNSLNLLLYKPDKTEMGKEIPGSIETIYEKLDLYQKKLGKPWDENNPKNNAADLWLIGFVFGLMRLCVISQGIAMRLKAGNASLGQAEGAANMYPYLSKLATESIDEFNKEKSKGTSKF